MAWDLILWILSFIITLALLASTFYQILSLSDLEADHLNPFETSARINYIVIPDFLLQGLLCALFLVTWHWFMFLLTLPLTAYNFMLYMNRRHLIDVTEVFRHLNHEKRYRFVKLGFYLILFTVVMFRLTLSAFTALNDEDEAEPRSDKTTLDSLQFTDEIQRLMCAPQDTGSSFTALLELSAPQAAELLHSPQSAGLHPANFNLIERAAKFSVLAAGESAGKSSTATTSNNSSATLPFPVKSEPAETTSSEHLVSDLSVEKRSAKRKEREKKVTTEAKSSTKKTKTAANDSSEEAEKLPVVHVRARRGQATDSHSLAERARRQKINARMKLLQELVPGCDKISGTALVLDEIINHVQLLQRQVEFLSMRLAAVNPRVEFNLDSILTRDGALLDSNFPSLVMPFIWPEALANGSRQQYQQQWLLGAAQQPVLGREEVCHNYVSPENSLLGYNLSTNSASLPPASLKMEL